MIHLCWDRHRVQPLSSPLLASLQATQSESGTVSTVCACSNYPMVLLGIIYMYICILSLYCSLTYPLMYPCHDSKI